MKKGGQRSLKVCYRVETLEMASVAVEEKEFNGNALAQVLQEKILERYVLRFQTQNTIYSEIQFSLENARTYKHYLSPKLHGTAT